MNILFTLCARAGSKGVKNKNLREFLGAPLLYLSLGAIEQYRKEYGGEHDIDIALNTDSPLLLAQLDGQRLNVIKIARKRELGGDRVAKLAVVADTLGAAESETGKRYDVVVDVDLTSPIRAAADIHGVIAALLARERADVCLSVTEARRNPYFNQLVADENGYLETVVKSNFVARQQAPEVFDANASLYAYRPGYLKDNDGILLHAHMVPWKMADTAVLDIDSERDFELLELIGGYIRETDAGFSAVCACAEEIVNK